MNSLPRERRGVRYSNLGFALDRAAGTFPDRPFLVDESSTRTYHDVTGRVERIASWLHARGIVRGDRVAAILTNRCEYVEVLLACARLGVVLAPINYRLAPEEAGRLIAHCSARVVFLDVDFVSWHRYLIGETDVVVVTVGDAEQAGVADEVGAVGLGFDDLLRTEIDPELAEAWRSLASEDPQAIHYTSGTTGRPKGVVRSHGANVAMAWGSLHAAPMSPDDAWVYAIPVHSAGFYALGIAALFAGARLVMCRKFDPETFRAAVRVHRATHAMLAPTMWEMVARSPAARPEDFASLRYAIWGGMPMSTSTLSRLDQLLPVPCLGGYGMTEATCATYSTAAAYSEGRRTCVGWPIPGIQIRVTDAHGRSCAPGEAGEVQLRGSSVMEGYLDEPERTAEVLDARGWLATGDIGSIDTDGALTIVDRKKHIIISGAENIFPTEVEEVLLLMDGVQQAAVVGVADEVWGEQVGAVLVAEQPIDLDDVSVHCLARGLAPFKRPRRLAIVDHLPTNALGKVQKDELVTLLRESGATDVASRSDEPSSS